LLPFDLVHDIGEISLAIVHETSRLIEARLPHVVDLRVIADHAALARKPA
jgi:hypothetical protein